MPRRKKATPKPIEDFEARKDCYEKRKETLLKKVEDLSTLCDVEACAIIFGPGDDVPNVWPSNDKAKEMIDQFENLPLTRRLRRNITPQVYMRRANNNIENQLAMLKKKNDEKEMSIFMHQIHDDGKSLSDFDASIVSRLLCFVEEKLKGVREKTGFSEQQLSPTPQVSCPLQNDIDSLPNKDEQVFQQQSLSFGYLEEAGKINSGFDNNIGSNIGLPSHTQIVGVGFGDPINEIDLGFGVLPGGNSIDINGNIDSGLLYGSSSSEILGGNGILSSFGNFGGTILESDMMLPLNNNSQGNINGTLMGTWGHQTTLEANNDEAAFGRSNPNFVGTNTNGGNLNFGFPSHANLASSGAGNDIE